MFALKAEELFDDPLGPHFHTIFRFESCKSGFSEIMME